MIESSDIERLTEIFVTRRECSDITESVRSDLVNDRTKLAVIEHQLKIVIWLITTVVAGVIAVLIKLLFGIA